MYNSDVSKATIIILLSIIIILIVILASIIVFQDRSTTTATAVTDVENEIVVNEQIQENKTIENEITVVPTLLDSLKNNTTWCGTFQLVWNDMQDNLVDGGGGGDVVFEPQISIVENLNKQDFKSEYLSEKSYYKEWGIKNTKLRDKIETNIKKKFNETSDILDLIDWSNSSEENTDSLNYLFYAMLKKEFEFKNDFDKLENGTFGNIYENIEYFGITSESKKNLYNQVEVLYYIDSENYAVSLDTIQKDKVILVRNPQGNNFNEIYSNIEVEKNEYTGDKSFTENDTLKVPNINMDIFKEYKELEGKSFKSKNEKNIVIDQAMQTIKMSLNNEGGFIKSEAAIANKSILQSSESRNFNFDDTFGIFLIENGKEKPYFASIVTNVTLFQ